MNSAFIGHLLSRKKILPTASIMPMVQNHFSDAPVETLISRPALYFGLLVDSRTTNSGATLRW